MEGLLLEQHLGPKQAEGNDLFGEDREDWSISSSLFCPVPGIFHLQKHAFDLLLSALCVTVPGAMGEASGHPVVLTFM